MTVAPRGRSAVPPAVERGPRPIARATVVVKVLLLGSVVMVALDPEWGHLTGKAPTARAVLYPMSALILPALWMLAAWRRRHRDYPWTADLLITIPGFGDLVGNRLNLYDRYSSFDDWIHFVNPALVSAGIVLLTMRPEARPVEIVERGVVVGVSAALAWELFEYVSFMTRSPELPDAYADTIGDLTLGWLGAAAGALWVAASWRSRVRV